MMGGGMEKKLRNPLKQLEFMIITIIKIIYSGK